MGNFNAIKNSVQDKKNFENWINITRDTSNSKFFNIKALDLKPHTMKSQSMWFESKQRQSLLVAKVTIPFILKWVH